MKRLLWIIFVIVVLCGGCRRHQPIDSVYGWPSSGDAVADSLLLEFERGGMVRTSLPDDVTPPGVALCSLASESDNPVVKFRASYVDARKALPQTSYAAIKRYIDSARRLIDSALNPFDWHMSMSVLAEHVPDRIERYRILRDNLSFFRKWGCLSEEARTLNDIGRLFGDFNDDESSHYFFGEAERICRENGFTRSLTTIRMNLWLTCSDSLETLRGLRGMLNDPALQSDERLMILLNFNCYIWSDSVRYIDRAIDLIRNKGVDIGNTPEIMAIKGDKLSQQGLHRQAIEYIRGALDSLYVMQPPSITSRLTVVEAMAYAYSRAGLTDSATPMWCFAKKLRDSIDSVLDSPLLYGTFFKEQMSLIEHNAELERSRQMWAAIALIVIIAAFAAAAFVVIRRREGRRRLSLLRRVRHSDRVVVAQKSVLEEHEKLIESISAKVTKESDGTGSEVSRLLSLHRSNKGSRESIIRLQNEVCEDFLLNLKHDFPALTEGQLRLAALIVSGADSHLIASILNIAPLSVNVNRHRLRTRLGLMTEDSLEDFLRRYNVSQARL